MGPRAGFLTDLDKIWREAMGASLLGVRIRIALLRSSVLTRRNGIDETLFGQCLAAGLLSQTLAEVIAGYRKSAAEKCRYLLLVADHANENQSRLLREAGTERQYEK